LGFADDRILLGEEHHPPADIFKVFLYDRLQEAKEVMCLLKVFFVAYFLTELAHEIGVVHEAAPQTKEFLTSFEPEGIQQTLYDQLFLVIALWRLARRQTALEEFHFGFSVFLCDVI
jgi:hypothetical protein